MTERRSESWTKSSGGGLIVTERDDSRRETNREVKRERQKKRQMNPEEETKERGIEWQRQTRAQIYILMWPLFGG